MRTLSILFIIYSCSFSAFAQYVLTATNANPQVGDSFNQDLAENVNNFNPGPAGANVTWDFSSFNAPDTAIINIKAATDPSYPSADIFFTQAGGDAYFSTGNAGFQFYGFDAAQVKVVFSDAEDQIRYPFTYGDSFSDTKSGTTDGFGQNAQRSGNVEVEADGYGNLITPDGNYPNALRLKIVRNDTDYFNGSAVNIGTDTIFYWYTSEFKFPVMSYVNLWQNGSQVYSAVAYLQDNSFGQTEQLRAQVAIYPNPTAGNVKVLNTAGNAPIKVYSLKGKLLAVFKDGPEIDLSAFEAGVYLIQIEDKLGAIKNVRVLKK